MHDDMLRLVKQGVKNYTFKDATLEMLCEKEFQGDVQGTLPLSTVFAAISGVHGGAALEGVKRMADSAQGLEGNTEPCPVCGEGRLHAVLGTHAVEYRGQKIDLPLHHSVCDVCGCEQGSTKELSLNKLAMQALKVGMAQGQPIHPEVSRTNGNEQ